MASTNITTETSTSAKPILNEPADIARFIPIPEPSRSYYVDVYTGQSIISYESDEILSALAIVAQFAHPAQCISFYSYKNTPYKFTNIYAP